MEAKIWDKKRHRNRNLKEGAWDWDTAAAYLDCTPGTLRVWASKRRVPFTKVGRLTRFRRADLDAWLDKNTIPAE